MSKKKRVKRIKKEEVKTEVPEKEINEKEKLFFLNKEGNKIFLNQFLNVEEIWTKEITRVENHKRIKKIKYIISHSGIEKIAKEAGIYQWKRSDPIVQPTIDNEMEIVFEVKVICSAKQSSETEDLSFCIHGFRETTSLGESNKLNTKGISRMYLATMAEKRAYDRAVISHLNLPDIFSEEEISEDLSEENNDIQLSDLEGIEKLITTIINTKDKKELQEVGKEIKKVSKDLSEKQVNHLRKLFENQLLTLTKTAF